MSKTGIRVEMVGQDGNAFACLGRCQQALRRAGRLDLWDEFHSEATSGDYYHLLATITEWFNVDLDEEEDDDEYDFGCENEDEY